MAAHEPDLCFLHAKLNANAFPNPKRSPGQPNLAGARIAPLSSELSLQFGKLTLMGKEFKGGKAMPMARVTSKGQITIPADIRRTLSIDQGDDVMFEVTSERSVQLKVVKRKRLSDLYGSLSPSRAFPGKDEVRDEVGQALGERNQEKRS